MAVPDTPSPATPPASTTVRRVALMIETDGPGGAESMLLTLACHLRMRGLEVFPVILADRMGWLSGRLAHLGFEVFQPRLRRPVDPWFLRTLHGWMLAKALDIVHVHEFTMGVYGGLASRMASVPFVLTLHGGTKYALALRRRLALGVVARQAQAVVGVSSATAEGMARALRIKRSAIRVVPNGIDGVIGDREAGRASLGLTDSDFLILSVGNLYPVKGHEFLIQAAGLLKNQAELPIWTIALAGRGGEEVRLRRLAADCGVQDRIRFLGLRDDIHDLLSACDMAVLPSLSEGMPIALLEAMSARRPVVSSAVGGIPELIVDGVDGLLVPPRSPEALAIAMSTVMRSPSMALAMAESAYHTAQSKFSTRAMIDAYLSLYDNHSVGRWSS